ncbi:hypothetical protein HHI36_022434 [Cryptolaemus montrouzieri]|uniref:Uncharacterized protein n=1 Tax=Cryptolaemus montrouzieri TaxID=559131 RepID=A0ABD2MZS6_9CUCU
MLARKSGVADKSEFSGSLGNSGKINLSYHKPSRAPSTVKSQKSTADQSIVNDPKIGQVEPKKNPIFMGNGDSSATFSATDVKENNVVTYLTNKFPNNNFNWKCFPKWRIQEVLLLKLTQIRHF